MSAYLCNPEHFAALAEFATRNGTHNATITAWRIGDRYDNAPHVAAELARQNIRSVAHRYPNDRDGERPGPAGITDQELIDEAARIASAMCVRPPELRTIDLLAMCDGYEYQACESADWRDTNAHHQIAWIRKALIRSIPGYADAPWNYETDRYEAGTLEDGTTGPICLSALMRRR